MARKFLILLPLIVASGCASFPITAKGECAARGHPEGSPTYQACREQVRINAAHMSQQNAQDMLGLMAIGAGAYGASQTVTQVYPQQGLNVAPLAGQHVSGGQRICSYSTGTALVQTTTLISLPCPASINY